MGVTGDPLVFEVGDNRVCHRVNITDDNICEVDPIEDFFSNLEYSSGIMPINIVRPSMRVIMIDNFEPECGKYLSLLRELCIVVTSILFPACSTYTGRL